MNKLRNTGDCLFGLLLVGVTFAVGYGAMSMVFEQAAMASVLLPQ